MAEEKTRGKTRLIPSLNTCLSRMQAGEKRFARCLEAHLEDDYLCWYELPVGARPRYSDFIILHPWRGLLLLEVKDWKLDSLQRMDRASATLLTPSGLKTVSNPLEQVRQCTYRLINQLEKDPQLVQAEGPYQGHLVFPYAYGVVLSNISRRQFDETDLGEVLPSHKVICKDEMRQNMEAEAFQEHLWKMFDVQFSRPLEMPQVDRIRWHLFPEIRIDEGIVTGLFDEEETEASMESLVPDMVRVMDRQQEILARSLGEGHRVIHGVAGSGKTLILGYRCLHLAEVLQKPVLVLCYNITLAARLRALIRGHGLGDKVQVYHFHDWCGAQLRLYHVPRPAFGDNYYDRVVEAVIHACEKGQIPRGQYGAVMIDEGHDFEAEWLKLVVNMVDPETNSLLLLYDDAQSIYGKRKGLDFSLSSVGVQARGRTTVLRLNYRNTDEILRFSRDFLQHYLHPQDEAGDTPPLVEPEMAGRHGPLPVVKRFSGYGDEAAYIARVLFQQHERKSVPWGDMCVLYRANWMGEQLEVALEKLSIPCYRLGDAQAKKCFQPDDERVKLMTMHASKGLEYPMVVVSGVGAMPDRHCDPVVEAKLLYVAMTRATEKLLVTSHRDNDFYRQLCGLMS